MPILPGPHRVVQSWLVPETHDPVVAAQESRHAFPVAVDVVSAQVAPSAEQTSPAQQSWFAPPQFAQVPFEHTVSDVVQRFPVQQGWLAWPHAGKWALS